jgi:hypothetical protein
MHHGHRDRRRQYVEVGEPSMITQLSDDAEYWQELAEDRRREVDRITNLRNLLKLKDLAEKAEECDRKALLAKRAELRNTFMDLAEQYRVLVWKVKASQKEHASSAIISPAITKE